MPYSNQARAFEIHNTCLETHLVVAEDISGHGHKRYHVVPRAEIEDYQGPFNELIRTQSLCRLYFDLDSQMPVTVTVQDLIDEVCTQISVVYDFQPDPAQAIVLCSSTETKYSKHIIFPQIVFRNNWTHMRQFVRAHITHPLVDFSVYSRNRCFRMLNCYKYSDPSRIFRSISADTIEQTLVQVLHCANPLECDVRIEANCAGGGDASGQRGGGVTRRAPST